MRPGEPGDSGVNAPATSLGARVHALRTRAGLSQAELAAAAGLSGSYVSLIEAGQRVPRKKALDQLSRALRITQAELLGSVPASPVLIEMELARAQSDIDAGRLPGALRKLDSLLRRYADSIDWDMEYKIRLARGAARCQAGDADHGLAELEDLLAETVLTGPAEAGPTLTGPMLTGPVLTGPMPTRPARQPPPHAVRLLPRARRPGPGHRPGPARAQRGRADPLRRLHHARRHAGVRLP
jgi:transcriptional regulator with XRE-family HTH domain